MAGSTTSSEDLGKLILRLTVAGLLLFHGISKLIHGVSWMAGPLAAFHLPAFISYGVYVGEVVAPLLIIVGVYTRLAGLVVSFDLFMAILLVSHSRIFVVGPSGGWGLELDAFYLLTGVCIFLLGAGKYSLGGAKGRWN
jgi:putative oxidoreductase